MNWMYSCKQVAQLLSRRLDEPMGLFDRIRLRVHLSMCDNCRNVEQQLSGVQALSRDLFSADLTSDERPEAFDPPGAGNQRRTPGDEAVSRHANTEFTRSRT